MTLRCDGCFDGANHGRKQLRAQGGASHQSVPLWVIIIMIYRDTDLLLRATQYGRNYDCPYFKNEKTTAQRG